MTERRLPLGFNTADENDLVQKGPNGLWLSRGPGEIIIPGRHLLRTIYTSGTAQTHNLQALTTKFRVYGQGPGSGGGGVDGQGGGTVGVGAPGASGAYFDHFFTVSVGITSLTYTVGQGGAGGTGTGGGAGQAGTANTTVTYNGTTIGGGRSTAGGEGMVATNTGFPLVVRGGSPAQAGAVVGSPNIGIAGLTPSFGLILALLEAFGASGADSVLGRGGGGQGAYSNTQGGQAGVLGGGGSGALVVAVATDIAGGAGGNGILIVEEYS